jgi:uncharacterized protein YjiS (DUF1127 family)
MKFINWLLTPYRRWQEYRQFKRRLKELQERDPFIYK